MSNRAMGEDILVLEGSQWTQLELHTGPVGNHPLWICRYLIENPEHVIAMHKEYLAGGSDILLALTYQLSVKGLTESYKLTVDEAMEKIQDAVRLGRTAWREHVQQYPEAKGKKQLVGGSAGPYGAVQHDGSEYTGSYVDIVGEDALVDWHRQRVKALVDGGVDFLAFETLPSIVEGRAVLRLLKEFPNTKAWISFNSQDGKNTSRGEPFGASALEIWQKGKDQLLGVGLNCIQPTYTTGLLKQVKKLTNEPIHFVVYPNSGENYTQEKGWHGQRMDLGTLAPEWINLGAKYVGGCCRTTVDDIISIRRVVDGNQKMNS